VSYKIENNIPLPIVVAGPEVLGDNVVSGPGLDVVAKCVAPATVVLGNVVG